MVVTASNGFNQIIEKDRDALMERTRNRPLPALRMTVQTAMIFSSLSMFGGLWLLYMINPLSSFFGAISILIYVLIYTPLKAKTTWAVFVGAIPGAIPFMLGWVAATNDFDVESGALFAIQFLWQFPHFWAIAWLLYDDYARAGYYLLPTRRKDNLSAFMTIIYSVWMLIVSVLPFFGITGTLYLSLPGMILVLLLGLFMVYKSLRLYKEKTTQAAKKLMFASIIYITLLQVIFVLDKFLQ
jgi:protoheme IX farnesyltransferase